MQAMRTEAHTAQPMATPTALPDHATDPLYLTPEPLTAQAFAPYGWMLDIDAAFAQGAGRAINAGTSRRADLPGELYLQAQGGAPLVTVFRAQAQRPAGPWRVLERHRLGSQSFVPLAALPAPQTGTDAVTDTACLLLVALGTEGPDAATLRAFTVGARQAFTLNPDTWHHPLIALTTRDFLVIERRAAQEDCELLHLARPVHIVM